MTKPARDYEKLRPKIMRAIAAQKAPMDICCSLMLHFPTLMRHLAKWKAEDRPPPVAILLPDADEATHFLEPIRLPIKQAANMVGKELDPERNERIRELRKKGLAPSQIAQRTGLSRGVIIGVINRAGMGLEGDELARARSRGAAKGGRTKKARQAQTAKGAALSPWNFSAGAHKNAAVFGKGAKGESTGPINIAQHYEPIPQHAVTIEHVTGCRWPFGDVRGEGIAYCNKPRCRVRMQHLSTPITTAYCVEHWDMRRASKNTKVIADNIQRLRDGIFYQI